MEVGADQGEEEEEEEEVEVEEVNIGFIFFVGLKVNTSNPKCAFFTQYSVLYTLFYPGYQNVLAIQMLQ